MSIKQWKQVITITVVATIIILFIIIGDFGKKSTTKVEGYAKILWKVIMS